MSAALKTAVIDLLLHDATFVAAMAALRLASDGSATAPGAVFKGFRKIASMGQEHYPCWAIESGDDNSSEESIGSFRQVFETELLLGLVWHQPDREMAVDQRDGLLAPLVELFLRNPAPANCGIRVDARVNDRSANHPTHVVTFRLLADVDITQ